MRYFFLLMMILRLESAFAEKENQEKTTVVIDPTLLTIPGDDLPDEPEEPKEIEKKDE